MTVMDSFKTRLKVEMLTTTNQNFLYLCGQVNDGSFGGNCFYFGMSMRTSYVVKVTKKDGQLIINTRNSVYTYKLIEGLEDREDGVLFQMDSKVKDKIEENIQKAVESGSFLI